MRDASISICALTIDHRSLDLARLSLLLHQRTKKLKKREASTRLPMSKFWDLVDRVGQNGQIDTNLGSSSSSL